MLFKLAGHIVEVFKFSVAKLLGALDPGMWQGNPNGDLIFQRSRELSRYVECISSVAWKVPIEKSPE